MSKNSFNLVSLDLNLIKNLERSEVIGYDRHKYAERGQKITKGNFFNEMSL